MRRFFSDDSFWNRPIGDAPETDPRSDDCISLLEREPSGNFHLNLKHYTIPVYTVDRDTPVRTVHQRTHRGERKLTFPPRDLPPGRHPDFGPGVPIPDGAEPDPASDAHMACVDPDRGRVWDMWAARRREDGEWESCTGMEYALDGEGVWRTSDFPVVDGESIHCHGPGRAAGVPIVAGLIMWDEVRRGEIRHKLAFASRYNAFKRFTSPATWTDGWLEGGLPEGCVVQLDPELDLEDYDLSPGARTVARALQEFGAVNVDNARATTLYGQGLYADPERGWEGVLGESDLQPIPIRHYRVLRIDEVTEKGDARHRGLDPELAP